MLAAALLRYDIATTLGYSVPRFVCLFEPFGVKSGFKSLKSKLWCQTEFPMAPKAQAGTNRSKSERGIILRPDHARKWVVPNTVNGQLKATKGCPRLQPIKYYDSYKCCIL